MSEISLNEHYYSTKGEIEFIVKDRNGVIIDRYRENNIVKIFAKEIISHRIAPDRIWDPNANSGVGGWVDNGLDLDEFTAKYIIFGASFNEDGQPLDTADDRFYVQDTISGGYVPKTLTPGAEYEGGLINAIPISEPNRPLKRIERIYFEPSYQPAGTPLLTDDVRAINNVLVLETTLRKDEYNGFGTSSSDFFTITEVALASAAEIDATGACECDPKDLFLGSSSGGHALLVNSSGSASISIDPSETDVDLIKEGDQIKLVSAGTTYSGDHDIMDQVNPYYLVLSKNVGGRDITLDRAPVDSDNNPITGQLGIFRDGLKLFSHRLLKTPVKKSEDFEITVRWLLIFN